jgi:outer membrane protein assembly factor BamB
MKQSARRVRAAKSLVPALMLGIGALAVGAAFANDWPELRGDVTRRGVAGEKIVPPLSLLWRYTGGPQNANQCSPAIVGDTAYFATRATADINSGGILVAVDTRTGARKWQFPRDINGLRDRFQFLTAPLVYKGRVYVGASDGTMYVVDAQNGTEALRIRTGRAINSAPAIVNDILYFGSNDGTFYALNPATGEPAWRQLYKPGDSINSAPIIADGMIFFTTNDNTVHAVRQATGLPAWTAKQLSRVLPNAPVYADSTLYVPSGQFLNALQPARGGVRWSRRVPMDIMVAPVADGGTVYVMCREERGNGSYIFAVRSNNGKDVWEKPAVLPVAPSAAPTISGDIIYVPTQRNMIYAVSREDGKILWEYYFEPSFNRPLAPGTPPPPQVSITAPLAISGGTLFALSDDGSLSAFRSDAPDSAGPVFSGFYPPPARQVNGQPPLVLAARALDMGSGLKPESVTMKLDNRPVTPLYDPARNLVYFQTKATGRTVESAALANGRHTVEITATDWRGNKTQETWSFIVNNDLAPATREAPAAPRPSSNNPGVGNQPGTNNPGNRPGGNRPGNRPGGGRGGRGGAGGPGAPGGGQEAASPPYQSAGSSQQRRPRFPFRSRSYAL